MREQHARLPHGVMNQAVLIRDGQCVRKTQGPSTRGAHNSLLREAAALRYLATAFPRYTPQLIAEEETEIVMTRMPGDPFPVVASRMSTRARRRAAREIGEALAQFHGLSGVGDISGLEWPSRAQGWRAKLFESFEQLARTAVSCEPALAELVARSSTALERMSEVLDEQSPRLVHGDYGGSNLHVDDCGALRAVLDWEWAVAADPDLDLARLAWLPAVGRSHRLWTSTSEERAFFAGYHGVRPQREETEAKAIPYGLWFAMSYLAVRLSLGRRDEARILVEFLSRQAQPGRPGARLSP